VRAIWVSAIYRTVPLAIAFRTFLLRDVAMAIRIDAALGSGLVRERPSFCVGGSLG
jgi:hypothetical protein